MSAEIEVCRLEDIADPGSREFSIGEGDWPLRGFLVRRDGEVYAYENRCPHAGHPLNWKPHAFLTRGRDRIICSSHGAVFEIGSGLCVGGPCPGKYLRALPVRVAGGAVRIEPPEGDGEA